MQVVIILSTGGCFFLSIHCILHIWLTTSLCCIILTLLYAFNTTFPRNCPCWLPILSFYPVLCIDFNQNFIDCSGYIFSFSKLLNTVVKLFVISVRPCLTLTVFKPQRLSALLTLIFVIASVTVFSITSVGIWLSIVFVITAYLISTACSTCFSSLQVSSAKPAHSIFLYSAVVPLILIILPFLPMTATMAFSIVFIRISHIFVQLCQFLS